MRDINRLMIFILLVGLLYALYVYNEKIEDDNKKEIKNNKNNDTHKIKKINNYKESDTVNNQGEESQTLGSLLDLDVDSFKSNNSNKSNDSNDSFFE